MSKIYSIFDGKIYINNTNSFNIKHICECGQLFRYQSSGDDYIIISDDKLAKVFKTESGYTIVCSDTDYFVNYFDLDTDYDQIKLSLSGEIMDKAKSYGYGIRILKQNLIEMIISFIISANNNIKRIQKTVNYICEKCGKDMGGYFAFPTLESLSKCDEQFFIDAGAGYRAGYLVSTIKQLLTFDFEALKNMSTVEARKTLCSFKGVGGKVADCILLFALSRKDVYPVDTWMEKVYYDYYYNGDKNPEQIRTYMTSFFGSLSGYAQQYLFYYKRELK